MIVSNPPYIPSHLVGSLEPEICRYEPRMALDGSGDGLGCIKEIISSAYRLLNPNGYLLLEIGHDQSAAIQKMVGICGHYRDLAFFKDYSGYERVVQMQKKWG
jgi:release factor glutamine methyltransferase